MKERTDEFGGGGGNAGAYNAGEQVAQLVDDLYGWEEAKGEGGSGGVLAQHGVVGRPE